VEAPVAMVYFFSEMYIYIVPSKRIIDHSTIRKASMDMVHLETLPTNLLETYMNRVKEKEKKPMLQPIAGISTNCIW
jgi:hypothetical protein